jgi:hypothetical protein
MMGFGRMDESEQNRVVQKSHNDLTVFLLGSEQEKQVNTVK